MVKTIEELNPHLRKEKNMPGSYGKGMKKKPMKKVKKPAKKPAKKKG